MARLGTFLLALCLAALFCLAGGAAHACPHDPAEQAATSRTPEVAILVESVVARVAADPLDHSCPKDTRKAHACCAFPLALPDLQTVSLRVPQLARYPRPLAITATPLPPVPLDKPPKSLG